MINRLLLRGIRAPRSLKIICLVVFGMTAAPLMYTSGGDGSEPQSRTKTLESSFRLAHSSLLAFEESGSHRGGDGSDPRRPAPSRGGDGSDPRMG